MEPVTLCKSSSLCGLVREKQVRMRLSPSQIEHFRDAIISWQASYGRHDLPWQQSSSAYQVHVSEIMLQQTQVATVIPYFQRWMQRFPTLESLANASEDDVMSVWQGLGYYSRARNLRRAAQYLVNEHAGNYPHDLTALNAIPGVGRYTAGAICSFAFNQYGPIIDGNAKRVYARLFEVEGEPNSSAFNKVMWSLAEQLTPVDRSRTYSQGVLDIGALVCKKASPQCTVCPLQHQCLAFRNASVTQFPNPKRSKAKPTKQAHFLWEATAESLVLVKRPSPGIWGGLWCFPELSTEPEHAEELGSFTHQFSHYRLEAKVWLRQRDDMQKSVKQGVSEGSATYTTEQLTTEQASTEERLVSSADLAKTGLPTPIRQFIEDIYILGKAIR